jgi:hypothetical protein
VDPGQSLLSNWPKSQTVVIGRPPPRIRQAILEQMRVIDFVGYAPAPSSFVRNQIESEEFLPLTYSQLAQLEAAISGVSLLPQKANPSAPSPIPSSNRNDLATKQVNWM